TRESLHARFPAVAFEFHSAARCFAPATLRGLRAYVPAHPPRWHAHRVRDDFQNDRILPIAQAVSSWRFLIPRFPAPQVAARAAQRALRRWHKKKGLERSLRLRLGV